MDLVSFLDPQEKSGFIEMLEPILSNHPIKDDPLEVLGVSQGKWLQLEAAGLSSLSCCFFAHAALQAMCRVRGIAGDGVAEMFVASLFEGQRCFGDAKAQARLGHWLKLRTAAVIDQLVEKGQQFLRADDFAGTLANLIRGRERDACKQQRQIDADFTQQVLLTQVYTPAWIVRFLMDSALEGWDPTAKPQLIDPACGSGRFLLYALDRLGKLASTKPAQQSVTAEAVVEQLMGWEIDPLALAIARCQLLIKVSYRFGEIPGPRLVQTICQRILRPGPISPSAPGLFAQLGSLVDGRISRDYPDVFTPPASWGGSDKFQVVVMNPPYLDKREYPKGLSEILAKYYPAGRGNLYGAFLSRMVSLTKPGGRWAVIAPQGWLFLKTFRHLRAEILADNQIDLLAHFGTGVFPTTVDTAAVVGTRLPSQERDLKPWWATCIDLRRETDKQRGLEDALARIEAGEQAGNLQQLGSEELAFLPDQAFLYELPLRLRQAFAALPPLKDWARVALGMKTSDNKRFLRYWWQADPGGDWVPYEKQTSGFPFYRRARFVVDWSPEAQEHYRTHYSAQLPNKSLWFQEGITFGMLSSRGFSAKYLPPGHMADMAANLVIPNRPRDLWFLLGVLNSRLAGYFLEAINPSVNFQVRDVQRLPLPSPTPEEHRLISLVTRLLVAVERIRDQWDPTSPDYRQPPLTESGKQDLAAICQQLDTIIAGFYRGVLILIEILDLCVYRLYGLSETDRSLLDNYANAGVCRLAESWQKAVLQWRRDFGHDLVNYALTELTSSGQGAGYGDLCRWLSSTFGPEGIKTMEELVQSNLAEYLQKKFYPQHERRWGRAPRLRPCLLEDGTMGFALLA